MSFEEYYERYFQIIYRYTYYMTSSKELAEDLTQETFLRLYNGSCQHVSSVETYLRKIARHLVYDYYRRRALIEWLPFTKKHADQRAAIDEQLIAEEQTRALLQMMQQLKPAHKEVLIYRKIEGYSIDETAALLGWSTTKVANTQRSAMKALARIVRGNGYEVE